MSMSTHFRRRHPLLQIIHPVLWQRCKRGEILSDVHPDDILSIKYQNTWGDRLGCQCSHRRMVPSLIEAREKLPGNLCVQFNPDTRSVTVAIHQRSQEMGLRMKSLPSEFPAKYQRNNPPSFLHQPRVRRRLRAPKISICRPPPCQAHYPTHPSSHPIPLRKQKSNRNYPSRRRRQFRPHNEKRSPASPISRSLPRRRLLVN